MFCIVYDTVHTYGVLYHYDIVHTNGVMPHSCCTVSVNTVLKYIGFELACFTPVINEMEQNTDRTYQTIPKRYALLSDAVCSFTDYGRPLSVT